MNKVNIIGNLTRDTELSYTTGQNQTAVCKFSVAVEDGWGEKKRTSFIPVVVFGKQAESCDKYLRKGSKVGVTGRLQTDSYENKEGKKVYTWTVVAEATEFLTPKNNDLPHYVEEQPRQFTEEEKENAYAHMNDLKDDIPF